MHTVYDFVVAPAVCIGIVLAAFGNPGTASADVPMIHVLGDTAAEAVSVGDSFFVELSVSGTTCINAFDIDLAFDPAVVEYVGTTEARSAFPMWVDIGGTHRDGEVTLVGGSLGTCLTAEPAPLARVAFRAIASGDASFGLTESSIVLAHDGRGTHITPASMRLDRQVRGADPSPAHDAWGAVLQRDTEGPEPFDVFVFKAPRWLGGGYHVAFVAADMESGIAAYEVMEFAQDSDDPGNGLWWVSGHLFGLRDQTLSSDIYVRAWDKAGNATTVFVARETARSMVSAF